MTEAKDRYDDMTGPVLAEELGRRELPVSGKVDELRDRLREDDARKADQGAQEGSADEPVGDTPSVEEVDVPEPRDPVDYDAGKVILSEDQARILNAAEASLARHFRYVFQTATRKYCAGDTVLVVMDWPNSVARVLPFGVEIPLDSDED